MRSSPPVRLRQNVYRECRKISQEEGIPFPAAHDKWLKRKFGLQWEKY